MRVGFSKDTNTSDANSGKHKFFIRLAREMESRGIKIDNKKPDVYVFLPSDRMCSKAKVNIVRLDGLIMNKRWNYKAKNRVIRRSIVSSKGIIYQGEFCHKAYRNFLQVEKTPYTIIPNGVSPNEFLPRDVKDYFLANCKWRPHKRLKEIVKSYLRSLKMGVTADLLITGEPDFEYEHPKVKYLGWVGRDKLKKLLAGAIASLHLSWLDWCPNSMVEAIVARCPVIYTISGGHPELGIGSGIGVKDTEWKFNVIDLYDPPPIDRNSVAEAMFFLESNKDMTYPKRDDLDISTVCDKYLEYFKKLLKGR
jgi:glycosyltransferase involved in cell wall biosynthesis